MEPHESAYYPQPDDSSSEALASDEQSLALRSREDWQGEVDRLEEQRDAIVAAYGDGASALEYDRDFNFLLGKIQVAHSQLAAHSIDEGLDGAIEDFQTES